MQDGAFDVGAAVEHVAAFKAGRLAQRSSVLELLGQWLEWLFVLVADNALEAALGTVGVLAALILTIILLDHRAAARLARAQAAQGRSNKAPPSAAAPAAAAAEAKKEK